MIVIAGTNFAGISSIYQRLEVEMSKNVKITLLVGILLFTGILLLWGSGLVAIFPSNSAITGATQPAEAGLPNPASAHCEAQGYSLEIRTDEQGGQYGICIFPDGSQCEEWEYYRGECEPVSGD
jgi:putative hemolysin